MRRAAYGNSVPSVPHAAYSYQQGAATAALLYCLLGLSMGLLALLAWQQLVKPPENQGRGIEVTSATLNMTEEQQLLLRANAHVDLPAIVQAGLDNGVPLTFILRLRVTEPRSYWLDKTVLDIQRQYILTYYELTRHYRVSALESGISRNYRSLSSALDGLGQLEPITVDLAPAALNQAQDTRLNASVEFRLSKSALPLPLRPIMRSNWTLVSEAYQWPLT